MRVIFRATQSFIRDVHADLRRPHDFAAERVAFIGTQAAQSGQTLLVLAQSYHPVADSDYVNDPRVGAMMGQEAIRKALEIALLKGVGMFHVHLHDHRGRPRFSRVDVREHAKFMPDFFNVRSEAPHGAIVFSRDSAFGQTWFDAGFVVPISEFDFVGPQMTIDILDQYGQPRTTQ